MGFIAFVLDIVRKLVISVLSFISIAMIIAYFVFYNAMSNPNAMLWAIIVPLLLISVLIKKN